MASKRYAQSYFIDTEGSEPDGIAILYLADSAVHTCGDADNLEMNPSIRQLEKLLRGDVIYYFPRNGAFEEETPGELNTLDSLLEDILELLRILTMTRNYRAVVVMGTGPRGLLAQEVKQSYGNLVTAAVNVELPEAEKLAALLAAQTVPEAQRFNIYTNLDRLDLSRLDPKDPRSVERFLAEHRDLVDEPGDAAAACQLFGNLLALENFREACSTLGFTTLPRQLGEESDVGTGFFGVEGKSGTIGILHVRAAPRGTPACGDTAGARFDHADVAARLTRVIEDFRNF